VRHKFARTRGLCKSSVFIRPLAREPSLALPRVEHWEVIAGDILEFPPIVAGRIRQSETEPTQDQREPAGNRGPHLRQRGVFDQEFVELAPPVYLSNDNRDELKRAINLLLKSDFIEERQYTPYAS